MRHHRLVLAALLLPLTCAVAWAALPTFWQVSTEAEFLRGEFENLSIDSYGRLTLGPTTTTLHESSAPFLWTVIPGNDGVFYAGTGNDGQVYRIDASGKAELYFDAEELEVHALATAPNGALYVGTSPDGRIYRVESATRSSVFFDPADKYIWSLAVDRSGNVFAATGDKGVIYKISPDGKGAPFYQTKATHAMTLAFDRQGRLLAGTESPGRVFQLDASGKPFVLLDSGYGEIHKLRVHPDGSIFAAAVRGRASGGSAPRTSDTDSTTPAADTTTTASVSVSTEITAIAIVDSSPATNPTGGSRIPVGQGTGAVFRIDTDGASEAIWESREDTPYDIAFDGPRDVLVATGNKGKIYRLSGDPYRPTLVTRANAEQVTTLAADRNDRTVFATSNPAKIFRLGSDRAERGTYVSDVRDAQTVATWGVVRWSSMTPSGTRVEISTRSGNTRTPDETWSDWSNAYNSAEGTQIVSPRARYLQWRAVLVSSRNAAPLLTSVTAAYLPRNLRPQVSSITIHPPGTVFQRQFPVDPEIAGFEGDTPDRRALARVQGGSSTGVSLGRRTYQKGLLTFAWRADDENRDTLSYDVHYRLEGGTDWKPLKQGVTDPLVVWDTTSVPNGRYVIRVTASDAPSNSPSTTLTGSLESMAFDVDNVSPAIVVNGTRRDGNRTIVTFDVRDADSAVQKVEYSLDGDRWVTIYPRDGIADSRIEQFELPIDAAISSRGVIVRATDALNNVTSTDVAVPSGSNGR
jgi:sugar lactone lactonase YvrE